MVGHYKQSQTFGTMPSLAISKVISRVSLPLYAKHQDDKSKLFDTNKRIVQIILILYLPICVVIAFIAPWIIQSILPGYWSPIVKYFQFILLFGFIIILNISYTQIFNAIGRSDIFLKTAIIKKSISLLFLLVGLRLVFGDC